MSSGVDMLSVRGDGQTTVTTNKPGVSALLATATAISYEGTVLEVRTTDMGIGSSFILLKVVEKLRAIIYRRRIFRSSFVTKCY